MPNSGNKQTEAVLPAVDTVTPSGTHIKGKGIRNLKIRTSPEEKSVEVLEDANSKWKTVPSEALGPEWSKETPPTPEPEFPSLENAPQQFESLSQGLKKMNELFCYVRTTDVIVRLSDYELFKPEAFIKRQYSTWRYKLKRERPNTDTGKTEIEEVWLPIAPRWVSYRDRTQVERMTYAPGQKQFFRNELNRWRGWGSTPDTHGTVGPWLALLEFLVPDAHARKWFEQWLAYPIQFPGTKLMTAAVLYSQTQGVGKDILLEAVMRIYGPNAALIQAEQLHEKFNSWQKDKQFIVGDEVQGSGTREAKKKAIEHLKSLITSETVWIDEKYQPKFELPNCANFVFTTNNPDAFNLANSDRRFWMWEVPQTKPKDDEFYQGFADWKNSKEGIARLHHHLYEMDLEDFSPSAHAPMTTAKQVAIELSRTELEEWLAHLEETISLLAVEKPESFGLLTADAVLFTSDDLSELWKSSHDGVTPISSYTLTQGLQKGGYRKAYNGEKVSLSTTKRVRLWIVAPPEKAERWLNASHEELCQQYRRQICPHCNGKSPQAKCTCGSKEPSTKQDGS